MNQLRLLALVLAFACGPVLAAGKTRNVVLLVCDGLRPEEVFTGAEEALLDENLGYAWYTEAEMRHRYWNPDPAERRKMLMPFLWNKVASQGQLLGHAAIGSSAEVANPFAISYPGYNEMASGVADPRISKNEHGLNPNVTVFEWLAGRPGFAGKVEVFGGWGTFHDIFNEQRSHLLVRSGTTLVDSSDHSPRGQLMQQLYQTTTGIDRDDPYDSFVNIAVQDHLNKHRPRVMFVGFGDTDNWAHAGRYDAYLQTAHNFDAYVEALWNRMQSLREYKDKTTFIITADHGRGHGPKLWQEHGEWASGSGNIWIAVIGPDTPPLGERHDVKPVTQSQIAATIAALLGEDFLSAIPKAAPPLLDVLSTP